MLLSKQQSYVELFDLSQRDLINPAISTANASEIGIVHDNKFLVAGKLHVDFGPVSMIGDRLLQCCDGVFRTRTRARAMSSDFQCVIESQLCSDPVSTCHNDEDPSQEATDQSPAHEIRPHNGPRHLCVCRCSSRWNAGRDMPIQ